MGYQGCEVGSRGFAISYGVDSVYVSRYPSIGSKAREIDEMIVTNEVILLSDNVIKHRQNGSSQRRGFSNDKGT